jgi:putative copper resistance protein D
MAVYLLGVYVHMLAAVFFVGYLLFWVTMVGPIVKRRDPVLAKRILAEMRQKFCPVGWLALFALIVTGIFLLSYRVAAFDRFFSGRFFLTVFGQVLAAKLLLVGTIAGYELFVGPRDSKSVWFGFICALLVIGLSVALVRAGRILI